jgi:hypothetical protein
MYYTRWPPMTLHMTLHMAPHMPLNMPLNTPLHSAVQISQPRTRWTCARRRRQSQH